MLSTDNCSGDYKKLYEMYNKAESILKGIGLTDITVRNIYFNKRLKSTLAWYIPEKKIIEVNTRHFACSPYDEVVGTIIHEISHNICDNQYKAQTDDDGNGHTKEWFEIATFITERTGYDIKPTTKVTIDKTKIIATPVYFHRFKCKICGYEYTAYSKKKNSDEVRKRKCAGCLCAHHFQGQPYCKGEFECIHKGINHYVHSYNQS